MLPPLTVSVQMIDLDASERDFYDCVYKRVQTNFDTFVVKGTVLNNYAHIFELLSRLRQTLGGVFFFFLNSPPMVSLGYV